MARGEPIIHERGFRRTQNLYLLNLGSASALFPMPRCAHDFLQTALRLPVQQGLRLGWIRHQRRRISRPSWYHFVRHRFPADFLRRRNNFSHGCTRSSPDIDGKTRLPRRQMFQRFYVSVRQVIHVYIVADASTIGRRIIITEHMQLRPIPRCSPQRQRNQMSLRVVQFPDFAAFVSPGRIEISQAGIAKPIRSVVSLKRLFEE